MKISIPYKEFGLSASKIIASSSTGAPMMEYNKFLFYTAEAHLRYCAANENKKEE